MKFATKAVRSGVEPDPKTGATLTPIYQTTTYNQPSVDKYMSKGYSYSRSGNPTVTALEKKLAALESGKYATCFSTGMASIDCMFKSLLNQGDHLIVSDVAYGGTSRLANEGYKKFGVEVDYVDTSKPEEVEKAIRKETKLILAETPANPTLKLTDIRAVGKIAKKRKVTYAVDNTFLTPYFQRPLEMGADISMESTTKYIDGHNATIGGALVTSSRRLWEKFDFMRNAMGNIMAPFDAWLTLQGVKTLPLRMNKQSENAMEIAEWLEKQPKVEKVVYPGLTSFPQHKLAKSQASGFGAMLWFEMNGGLKKGKKLMDSVKLCSLAENLGPVETLITHPATMTHSDVDRETRLKVGISDGLVRLSVGIEDAGDIISDLGNALKKV